MLSACLAAARPAWAVQISAVPAPSEDPSPAASATRPPVRRPRLEVTAIHALRSDAPASVDPRLGDLARLVHERPFARYNVFRLIDRRVLPLAPGETALDPLANGRQLRVELVGADAGDAARFRLRAAIEQPGQLPFVRALEVTAAAGEPFFVGGQSYLGGSMVLELVVRWP